VLAERVVLDGTNAGEIRSTQSSTVLTFSRG
jgi:hypothetical protein